IRSRRSRPGLQPQHLAAVKAAAAVGQAKTRGAEPHSQELIFEPGSVSGGDYRFDIGTAGSTMLVLQTILPALLTCAQPSALVLVGGTHNPLAPSFEFIQRAFLPLIKRMGPRVDAQLERPGFYPRGGGIVGVRVAPASVLQSLELRERGDVSVMHATALLAHLPRHIAIRELGVLEKNLGLSANQTSIVEADDAFGPGNAVNVVVESRHVTEVFTAIGQKGVPAETVAQGVAAGVRRYLDAGVPVGEHLADQLLLPVSLSGSGRFTSLPPTRHTRTNLMVIAQFTGQRFHCAETGAGRWEIGLDQARINVVPDAR
ncbi:MAG: RNA 3'-terminal phosphate cyclase, partial [Gammaproteobacteria bacterium]